MFCEIHRQIIHPPMNFDVFGKDSVLSFLLFSYIFSRLRNRSFLSALLRLFPFLFAYNQYPMVMKKYELKNNKALGRYEFDLNDAAAAADYEECGPGCVAVTHTGAPDRFCGQGIASQLTVTVLEDLKRQGLKAVPLCRFMVRYILRHPEWKQMVVDK